MPRFEEPEMMSIAQAVPDTAFTAIWTNNADSLVYLRHERFANLHTTNPPAIVETVDNMELPGNVLDQPFTLQILEKGRPVAVFGPVQFLKIISANDDKLSLPLTSTDGRCNCKWKLRLKKTSNYLWNFNKICIL